MATVSTLDKHISITPGLAGGKPHVTGHRISVQNIVIWHEWLGRTADEIATEYDLPLASVYAALAYYHDHRAEIEASIAADEKFAAALKEQLPSRVTSNRTRLDHDLDGDA